LKNFKGLSNVNKINDTDKVIDELIGSVYTINYWNHSINGVNEVGDIVWF